VGRKPWVEPVGQAAWHELVLLGKLAFDHLGESRLDSRKQGMEPQAHLEEKSCRKSQKPWIHRIVLIAGRGVDTPRCTMADPD